MGRTVVVGTIAWTVLSAVLACQSTPSEPSARPTEPPRPPATAAPPGPAATGALTARPPSADGVPARPVLKDVVAERLVAIGDLHGDLAATRNALKLAGAIDDRDGWVGGRLVVVQTGDQIDRNDDDRAVLELFDRLADSAEAAGGKVISLNGNHEVMNVQGDFRYITPASFASFAEISTARVPADVLSGVPPEMRGRFAAFYPGGPFALRLGQRDVVVQIGETVFVHGGIREADVRYGLDRLNREVKSWMNGSGSIPSPMTDSEGPVWTRRYSDDSGPLDCAGLATALSLMNAKRMVVGHTVHQSGITAACEGKVWRIDTGLSHYYGGPTEVLQIAADTVSVLRLGK